MNGIKTFRELKPNQLIQQLIATISNELPHFPSSDEFKEVLAKKKNENQHSTAFCLYMTNSCKSKFYFSRENAQKGSRTIDIGIYKGAVLIFVIEAKLLPTPEGTKEKPRYEHEYVHGKGAGIQRFKDGQHGFDNQDSPFLDSGMLAFVKENDFDFWLKQVNKWILEAKWTPDEQLTKIKIMKAIKLLSSHPQDSQSTISPSITNIAFFLSAHLRTDGSMIRLHHFWVLVS